MEFLQDEDYVSEDDMYGDFEDGDDYGMAASPVLTRQGADELDPDNPLTWGKVGRNEACPCGSGKKYKHCHGAH